ncbi:MAG: class I SAM-dependent methyltransferase [Cyanobacteria bacterium CRU_2_1]|nr:class I SAM-dependent methyltransferase [Cyanobacteria bacterium CRU_2_1]
MENLANLSFPDESFDIVIGTQSMEHWAEFSCTLQWGLYQCFRACKPGGYVLMNVPIHFHGTRPFMLGELQTLQRLFAPFSDQVTFHKWGYPSDPLTKLFPYPGYSRLHDKPAYILDIHAIKDRPLPNGYTNLGAASGRLAKLLNSHPSYITYRAFDKAKQFFASIGLSSFHQDETPEFKL